MIGPWVLSLWLGCTSGEVPPVTGDLSGGDPAPPADLDGLGWVSHAALDPASFAALLEGSRDGWVALHAHRPDDAVVAFADDPIGRGRAELELVVLYGDLARVSALATEALFQDWSKRGTLPPGNDAPMAAALAARCVDGESATAWASKVGDGPEKGLAMAVAQGRNPVDFAGDDPWSRRMAVHRKARAAADPAPLLAVAGTPVRSVEEKDFSRHYWDPCVYTTLSGIWTERLARTLSGTGWRSVDALADAGLAGSMFAAWGTGDDLRATIGSASGPGELGGRSPLMRRLGAGTETSSTDDPESARELVRTLDAALDAWSSKLLDQADPDGQALLRDLGLVARLRQEWLMTTARSLLAHDRPHEALVTLELARDHGASGIGPSNAPALYALLVEARLRLGHTREALDELHALADTRPEVLGLRETLGDLAVLQGLDRTGDSKEN